MPAVAQGQRIEPDCITRRATYSAARKRQGPDMGQAMAIPAHEVWQRLYPPGSHRPGPQPDGETFAAELADGRQLMLPIRVLPGGRDRAVASLILNQAAFEVLDALADTLAAAARRLPAGGGGGGADAGPAAGRGAGPAAGPCTDGAAVDQPQVLVRRRAVGAAEVDHHPG